MLNRELLEMFRACLAGDSQALNELRDCYLDEGLEELKEYVVYVSPDTFSEEDIQTYSFMTKEAADLFLDQSNDYPYYYASYNREDVVDHIKGET